MDILHPKATAYCEILNTPVDGLLQKIEAETMASHPKAHMLSGAWQGKWLEMMMAMIQPRRVLELGTFTGYSALAIMQGMPLDGTLDTIECREQDAATAQAYFDASQFSARIRLHVGNALDIIPTLTGPWDLVFLDADKVNYIAYYDLILPFIRTGGWLIADNVFFHGEVFDETPKGKNPKAIDAFNRHVASDDRVEQIFLPLRDGLLIIMKK
jgi:predicted O-methyltransferase YrrM